MKSTAIFVCSLIWIFYTSGSALASNCDRYWEILDVKMEIFNRYVNEMKGTTAQVEIAAGIGDNERVSQLEKQLSEVAFKVVGISSEVLDLLRPIDEEPANCGGSQVDLDDMKAYMKQILTVAKKIIG